MRRRILLASLVSFAFLPLPWSLCDATPSFSLPFPRPRLMPFASMSTSFVFVTSTTFTFGSGKGGIPSAPRGGALAAFCLCKSIGC